MLSLKFTLTKQLLASALCVIATTVLALGGSPSARTTQKTQGGLSVDVYKPFLINNIFNYYGNNGDGSCNKFSTSNEGFEFPKGSGKTCVYEDGIVWGGYHRSLDTLAVGGSTYWHGLQAGKILTPGTAGSAPVADNPAAPQYRVYRVRPDINPAVDFTSVESELTTEEVAYIGRYESVTAQQIYDSYIQDWNEWPAADGAPYTDVNHNGTYDPLVDIPGVPGADQTLWYVANDLDGSRTMILTGSNPIGLEMQRTIWGFKRSGVLGNVVFASTLLINKSGAPVDSMFLVQWADPDLGDAADDFVGCDTARQLGYVYNGGAVDAMYGVSVPAVGYFLLQGPRVPSPGNSALFHRTRRAGFRNLPMTAFTFFTQGPANFADPSAGIGGNTQWYRLMNGLTASTGSPFIDPVSGQPTKFCLTGDPTKSTDGSAGWVDGLGGLTPQDRRLCIVSGPFTMADEDSQEIVVATAVGQGADRISSISALRNVWDRIDTMYDAIITDAPVAHQAVGPQTIRLEHNYPNPFNPGTTIEYTIAGVKKSQGLAPSEVEGSGVSEVRIEIYDVLGRKVTTLVNSLQAPGTYEVKFDGSRLVSGVYFCRMTAGSSTKVIPMTLAK